MSSIRKQGKSRAQRGGSSPSDPGSLGPLFVLMTDFGLRDPYVGIMKAVILSIHPQARFVDLTHDIEPQNIVRAACSLENAYRFFPPGSLFVCVVDPGVGTQRKPLCVRTKHYCFLGPDNGIFTRVLRCEKAFEARSLTNRDYFLKSERYSNTFHGRDIFAPVAAHLAHRPAVFSKLGPKVSRLQTLDIPEIQRRKEGLQGTVLYFDHFGNAITNIRYADAGEGVWRKAEIFLGNRRIGRIKATYGVPQGTLIPLFNSAWQLELARPGGSAKKTGSIHAGDPVTVRVL